MGLSCKYRFGVQKAVSAEIKEVLATDFPEARIINETWRDGFWEVKIECLSEYEEFEFKLKLSHICEISRTGTEDRPVRTHEWAVSKREADPNDKEALLVDLSYELNARGVPAETRDAVHKLGPDKVSDASIPTPIKNIQKV